MYEKVNPCHPDKVADRIAGAIVDYVYTLEENPKIAVEVLIGHGECTIIAETSSYIDADVVTKIVERIVGDSSESIVVKFNQFAQDSHLADNQRGSIRCGDNGIFKGVPITMEQVEGREIAEEIYNKFRSDGKYIIDSESDRLIICQSNATTEELLDMYPGAIVNPLGYWTGGINVDTGATNRKLGSDMGDAVTGGGLHGKDLSKADVSVNIFAHLLAEHTGKVVTLCCAIGDEEVGGFPYSKIVERAREYVKDIGGFEKLAEWGLI